MGILRPLDCIVIPLLACHSFLWFIARVTYAAVCREAILPEKTVDCCESLLNCDQFRAVISEAGATRD